MGQRHSHDFTIGGPDTLKRKAMEGKGGYRGFERRSVGLYRTGQP